MQSLERNHTALGSNDLEPTRRVLGHSLVRSLVRSHRVSRFYEKAKIEMHLHHSKKLMTYVCRDSVLSPRQLVLDSQSIGERQHNGEASK